MILKWCPCGVQAVIQFQSNKGINDHCKVPTLKKKKLRQMEKISTTAAVWSSKCWSGSNKTNCEPVSHTEHSLMVDNHPQAYFLLFVSSSCCSKCTYLVLVFIWKKVIFMSIMAPDVLGKKTVLTAYCSSCFLTESRNRTCYNLSAFHE